MPQLGVVLKAADQPVGVRKVEEEAGTVGPPHSFHRIAGTPGGVVQSRESKGLASTASSCAAKLGPRAADRSASTFVVE